MRFLISPRTFFDADTTSAALEQRGATGGGGGGGGGEEGGRIYDCEMYLLLLMPLRATETKSSMQLLSPETSHALDTCTPSS